MWRWHRHDTTASRSGGSRPLDPPVEGRVVIVTRQCRHLRDEAIEFVARMRQDYRSLGCEPTIVDVAEGLRSRWSDHVPVTFVDGDPISYWTLDADAFMPTLRDGPTLPAVLP